MSAVLTIAGYGFREAVRRKVFAVVVLLTALFLALFWLANHFVFTRLSTISPPADVNVDTRTFAGAFLLGLAMFATLFLGVVLAVFLTLGDPRESPEVGQADLHRFPLHVEEGIAVELGMASADPIASALEHPDPVSDEVAFAVGRVLELAS